MKEPAGFDGPRPIRPAEYKAGEWLSRLCFGRGLPEAEPDEPEIEAGAGTDDAGGDPGGDDGGDPGWIVIVPQEGPMRGKPVAQIGIGHSQVQFGGSRLRVGSIGGVCTHPDFRQMGLAGVVLADCARRLRDEGAHLMLISGMRGLYTRTGNVVGMRFHFFQLLPSHLEGRQPLPGFTTRPASPGEAAAMAAIQDGERVGYVRTVAEYPEPDPCRAVFIEADGVPVAYLLLGVPWEHRRGPERGVREVAEYAGSRLALAAGIEQILGGKLEVRLGIALRELRIAVAWQDTDMLHLLQALSPPVSQESLPGHTMRLLNFPALRADLEAYISARLPERLSGGLCFEQSGPLLEDPDLGGETGDRCAIVWNDSRLELSTSRMTRLVMGDWEETASADWNKSEPLGEIVHRLFPLPSFQPGINYR